MYFKRLELLGFKSFCDKTILHFEPGVTAIVGPNGCGKSNIFDSIRWVLGEQSVKALRGSDMQDVIFNGTDKKEPLGMAEVSLVFDNSTKFFSVDHPEVMVTRRIFRSGESEYLLNKTQVRLKDILDILLGTGIGAESYSLIQQGKIDLVLSSKPEERRLVFDEAAGITKYKAQKREAIRKLEETDQNLLRVNDIITEVKRQIGSLERQASKARRYKEVFEELKNKEIKLGTAQKKVLLKQKDAIIQGLENLEKREAELSIEIKEKESSISNRQNELKSLEEKISCAKNKIAEFENLIARDKQHIAFNRQRISELESSRDQLIPQIEQAKSRIAVDEEKLNKFKLEYDGLSRNIENKKLILKSKESELENITAGIKLALDIITEAKKNILELAAKISNIKNTATDLNSKQQIFLARKKRLELEKAKVNEEKAITETSLNEINQEIAVLGKDFNELQAKIASIKSDLENEVVSIKSVDSDIEGMEKQILKLLSQKEFLTKLKTEYEGIGDSMNATVYLDKPPQEILSGLVIKINSHSDLNSSEGFKLQGEAKPIDLDTQKISEKIEQIQHSIDSLKLIKRVKESRIEELNKEISDAEVLLRAQEISLANKKASALTIDEQFNKIKGEDELICLELTDVDNELKATEGQIGSNNLQLQALEGSASQAEVSINDEQNRISLNNKLKEESLIFITQTRTELDDLNRRITADQATLKMLEDGVNQDKFDLSNLEQQLKECSGKCELFDKEIVNLENNIQGSNSAIENETALFNQAKGSCKAITDELSGTVEAIDSGRQELDEIKNKLYELQMQNKDVDFKYLNIKERMLQAYKVDLDFLNMMEESEKEAEGIVEAPGTEEQVDETLLQEEISRLKEKIDSYGSVNLVAIEEYDELKKRYDFLTQQENDLTTAKQSLHEAILKINRTTKKMFLDTFELVRVEFRNYFRLLFNGGDAQVFLIDENDPLESGIEIICRPPGKKLQNVLLLSGGEKSMSAIALIFAIFKVKPAPFCILDEIDAALDEANVDRFGRMLHEFAQISQFIVITHNKKTIANTDVMYGITMQESGVSKIVSVKFSKNPKKDKDKEEDAQPVGEPV